MKYKVTLVLEELLDADNFTLDDVEENLHEILRAAEYKVVSLDIEGIHA